MGYFSQKKKHQRENTFLLYSGIGVVLYTLFLFLPQTWLNETAFFYRYLFQFYIFVILLFLFGLWRQRWGYVTLFLLCLLVQYTFMASTANLFFNQSLNGEHHLDLTYKPADPLGLEASGMVMLRSGHLNLDRDVQAPFVTFEKNLHVFTVIGVNLNGLDKDQINQSLKSLRLFIDMQDDPVVVYGQFGLPAWAPAVKQFLQSTDLQVKNRLLLIGKHTRFNPLAVPDFYILGYDNTGVNSLEITPGSQNTPLQIKAYFEFL